MIRYLLLTLVLSLCFLKDTSAQTISWSTVNDVSVAGGTANNNDIALSADATKAIAVWGRSNGSNTIVQARVATISGNIATWGPVSDLSATGRDADYAKVALSADGSMASVVWQRYNGSRYVAQSISATISGNVASWGSVSDISSGGESALYPQIGMSNDGTKVTTLWLDYYTNVMRSVSGSLTGNIATWGTLSSLSTSSSYTATDFKLKVSSDGSMATAAWNRRNLSNINVLQTSSASISGTSASWGTTTDLSTGVYNTYYPDITLSPDGSVATIAWEYFDGTDTKIQRRTAAIVGNAATWSAIADLVNIGANAFGLAKLASTDGTKALSFWLDSTGNATIKGQAASLSGTLVTSGTTINVSDPAYNTSFLASSLTNNGIYANTLWLVDLANNGNYSLQSRSAVIDGSNAAWGGTFDLTGTHDVNGAPALSSSPDGTTMVAIWTYYDGSNSIAQSSVATVVFPTLTPTPTATATVTPTSTQTPTLTPTQTPTLTATSTVTPTATQEPQATATPSPLPTKKVKVLVSSFGEGVAPAPKLSYSLRLDGGVNIKACAPARTIFKGGLRNIYGVNKLSNQKKQRSFRTKGCFSFTVSKNGIYEAFFVQSRWKDSSLFSKRVKYQVR